MQNIITDRAHSFYGGFVGKFFFKLSSVLIDLSQFAVAPSLKPPLYLIPYMLMGCSMKTASYVIFYQGQTWEFRED